MNYSIRCLDEQKIPYHIIKGKYKRLLIKYDAYGILEIHQPLFLDDVRVIMFIEEHLDWIVKHKPCRPLPHDKYEDGMTYLLLGKEYLLEINYSNHENVYFSDSKIIVHAAKEANIEKLLDKFRYEQAEIVFNEMLYKCFESMKSSLNKYPTLVIKKSVSRWGCCYYNKNQIMLNIALIHVPLILIEYVIYHELVHFLYPNHSKDFHNELKKYVSDEVKRRKYLKNYSVSYK